MNLLDRYEIIDRKYSKGAQGSIFPVRLLPLYAVPNPS